MHAVRHGGAALGGVVLQSQPSVSPNLDAKKHMYVCYVDTDRMVNLAPAPTLGCTLSLLPISTQWQAVQLPQLEGGPKSWLLISLGIILTVEP